MCGRTFVVQQSRHQRISLCLQSTPTEQRDFTNKQNTAEPVCSCFLRASTCCFGYFIPCFPTFSAAFVSLSFLLPVSSFAHTLKSLSEFFTHAMSFPGAQVPSAHATPSVPLEEDTAAIRGSHWFSAIELLLLCPSGCV